MIEIMDTTLRDGEQTSGVSFAAHEKLSIAQVLLNDLGVNRVEIASARVSDGEFEAVKRVAAWAARSGNLDKLVSWVSWMVRSLSTGLNPQVAVS